MLQPPLDLAPSQRARLEQFGAAQSIDIHCHCLPGLDDGPRSDEDSLALCRSLVEDGLTHVVATPHQLGRYDGKNESAQIREAVETLSKRLEAEQVPLTILPGADVRVDERIIKLLTDDRVMTIADARRFLLLELPHETYIDLRLFIRALKAKGITPIITHPERHHVLAAKPHLLDPWLAEGAVIQITAGSLTGDFGPEVERAAWDFLNRSQGGLNTLIATDAHDAIRRGPRMTAAIEAITSHLSHETARRVCIENPHLVLSADE